MTKPAETRRFREVLGHFPTGVAVITGMDAEGNPVGLAIGSFSSVSLRPPLVAFMPDRGSTSWPRIRESGRFCVNILGADQEAVCRAFAVSGGNKFADLGWRPAGSGSPIIDGVLAWIDCDVEVIHEAGDHFIVIGAVRDLDVTSTAPPLVFFQGGYGRFSALSLAVWEGDLSLQIHTADLARPYMEDLAEELDVACVASAVVGSDIVLIARVGPLESSLATAVGHRVPLAPPMGLPFVAWAPEQAQQDWLDRLPDGSPPGRRAELERDLLEVRSLGYSISASTMGEADSAEGEVVRSVSTPVFGPSGEVVLFISAVVAGRGTEPVDLGFTVERLRAAAATVSSVLVATHVAPSSAASTTSARSRGDLA
jgi:flavin reductase (DIM6/NTAB) family NADH-FMN oxidoreductase RutF/DNA-binding IclR family transcriptional regulator